MHSPCTQRTIRANAILRDRGVVSSGITLPPLPDRPLVAASSAAAVSSGDVLGERAVTLFFSLGALVLDPGVVYPARCRLRLPPGVYERLELGVGVPGSSAHLAMISCPVIHQ